MTWERNIKMSKKFYIATDHAGYAVKAYVKEIVTNLGHEIIDLGPETIVPGHGPLCGIEGAVEMKAYLEFVRREAEKCFDRGLSEAEAAGAIDLGEYASWTEPERIVFNVVRAYREFRGVPPDTPIDFVEMVGMMKEIRRR